MNNKFFNSLGVVALSFCTAVVWTEFDAVTVQAADGSKVEHVIFVGLDGLAAKTLTDRAQMPTLYELMDNGAYTFSGRTILPSSSACNWASIFMGAGTEIHGYLTWDAKEPAMPPPFLTENGRFPDIFMEYHKANPKAEIGYIYEWDGMAYLADPKAFNYTEKVSNCTQPAIDYIKTKKPNLFAIVYDQPDGSGHKFGWGTPEYMENVKKLDTDLSKIVDAIKEAGIMDSTVLIVTSDHGGINKGHGGTSMNEMLRPLVFFGKDVKKKFEIKDSTVVYDMAPTIAYLLDVPAPQVWTGRPIKSAFEK